MNDKIIIKGAKQHNLKNINLEIPRDKLVVITGVSGSGKSSLAFDTLYAEGQRRYVESLSSYARQFLGLMEKPDVELIEGLSPAISIDQKTTSKNPRSTVGTVTEIYDYIRLLYARIGVPYCPNCGKRIEKQTIDQIVDNIMELEEGTKIQVLSPIIRGRKGEFVKLLLTFQKEGFVRARIDGETVELSDDLKIDRKKKHNVEIIVDRLVVKEEIRSRLTESVEIALKHADNIVMINVMGDKDYLYNKVDKIIKFSNGSEILFSSLEDPEKFKSLNLHWAEIEEASQITDSSFKQLLGNLDDSSDSFDSDSEDEIEKVTEQLYGLIHARYIFTQEGINEMTKKFTEGVFGICPRYSCQGTHLVPIAMSDKPNVDTVKTYCYRCKQIYETDPAHATLDGAYFTKSFAHYFLLELREAEKQGRNQNDPSMFTSESQSTNRPVKEKC